MDIPSRCINKNRRDSRDSEKVLLHCAILRATCLTLVPEVFLEFSPREIERAAKRRMRVAKGRVAKGKVFLSRRFATGIRRFAALSRGENSRKTSGTRVNLSRNSDKLQETLLQCNLATAKNVTRQVAETVAESRIEFYFPKRFTQRCSGFCIA